MRRAPDPWGHSGRWRSYRITAEFVVPLAFAYRWCTDYTPEDPRYAGEDRTIGLRRRIVSRSPRRVVFENLYDAGGGWAWERCLVTLRPPDRWHCETRGNYGESVLDYRLTAVGPDRTRLEMGWKSRPGGFARGRRPGPAAVEAFVRRLWRRRATALERAYRALRARHRGGRRRRRGRAPRFPSPSSNGAGTGAA